MQTQGIAGERQHVAKLPAAQDADGHRRFFFGRGRELGLGFASTHLVCDARNLRNASRICGCLAPRIAAASSAALMAPALPMASAPTGIPPGICAMDSSESRPFRAF